MTDKNVSSLSMEAMEQIQRIIGREIPALRSVRGLANLPLLVLQDTEMLNRASGSILAFGYLYHVTDASFSEVKLFVTDKGWSETVG